MQRLLISFSSLVAFAASAHAQTAPAPDATPPTEPAPPAPAEPAPPPPVTPAPPPPVVVEVPPPPPKPAIELPKRLAVGKESPGSFLTFGLNLQGWFVYDGTSKAGAAGAEDVTLSTTTFRVRRLEISGAGEIIPKFVKFRFMFDPARVRDTLTATTVPTTPPVVIRAPTGAITALQDFFITFSSDVIDVSVGQFKHTISWDGFNSAAKLILPERAFVVTQYTAVSRDIGLRFEKVFKLWSYCVELVNGAGQNTLDNNNQKDISTRLEIYPIPGLTIAGATYNSIGYRTKVGTRDRFEGDLRFESGPFLFQSEFIKAADILADNGTLANKGKVNSLGGYAALAYTIKGIGGGDWRGDIQPVVRVGYFDPNSDANLDPSVTMGAPPNFNGNNDERLDFEVGLNYYLRSHEMKFQASFDHQQFDNSDANTNFKRSLNELIVSTQVWF